MTAESDRPDATGQSMLDVADRWYHVPVLLVVMVIMFAIRMQSYRDYIRGNEVFFSGNDAWYHYRSSMYTVKHWPFKMPFDPWTYYPFGDAVGQFGTLFDLIVATFALIIGLGDPSPQLVGKVLLVAPAAFGTLAVLPVYLIAKRFAGRLGGLFGAIVLMLLPGTFLQRSLVGVADHNGAEPLFMGLAVLGLLIALGVAERTMPIWEVVREEATARELDTLREPLLWAGVAGFLMGLYLWLWPPAMVLVGVVGIFTVVKVTSDVVNGTTPEPTVFAVTVAMVVTSLFAVLLFQEASFSTTDFSFLHILTPLAVAVAGVVLAALAREWDDRDISVSLFPAAVFGLGLVGLGFLAFVVPSAFDAITRNLLRTVGFSAGAATRTIGEAQPFLSPSSLQRLGVTEAGRITLEYGLTFFTALAAAVWFFARPLYRKGDTRELGYIGGSLLVVLFIFAAPGALAAIADVFGIEGQVLGLVLVAGLVVGATLLVEYEATDLFLFVWAAFVTSMAFTQIRFNYYLAIPVAVFNGILFAQVIGLLDLDRASVSDSITDVEGYQVLTVIAVILLVLAPVLAIPISVGTQGSQVNTSTAWQSGNQTQRASSMGVLHWDGTFDWMRDNTPKEGNLGGANNADQMEYYGRYDRADDYDYPDGSYGVMSWWDYGHWITVQGERIPNANPFQHGATQAANFLLAPNETQANNVLQDGSGENEETRYVMVDWQMASTQSKFGAPIIWYNAQDVSSQDFYTNLYVQQRNQEGQVVNVFPYGQIYEQRYYESTMVRLYRYHGSAQDPAPVVTDWEQGQFQNQRTGESVQLPIRPQDNTSMIKTFDNMSAARAYVKNDSTSKIGGVGPFPNERVEALQHYRLVKMSESQTRAYFANEIRQAQLAGNPVFQFFLSQTTPAWVKTFERVPGATVEGSGAPPNTEVKASVEMHDPSTNTTFTYTQYAQTDENGNFEMVLPYSTTGYENFGPENGYTNVSVRANSSYTVTAPATTADNGSTVQSGATFDVSEAKVIGEDESAKQVTLTEKVQQPEGANETNNNSSGNSTNSSAMAGSNWVPTDEGSSSANDGSSDWNDAGAEDDGRTQPTPQVARPSTVAALD